MGTITTIAYDPKAFHPEKEIRYEFPGPRETRLEQTTAEPDSQENSDEFTTPYDPNEDWMKMYAGRKIEENY